jgi:hypothetical protein
VFALQSRTTHTALGLFKRQLRNAITNAAPCLQYIITDITSDDEMPSSWVAFVLIPVIAILTAYLSYPSLCLSLCSQTCAPDTRTLHSGYFEYECASAPSKPHHASWSSWWHPHRSDGTPAEHKKGAGSITAAWNILYHLGGNGPWVEKIIDTVDGGVAVPEGCQIEQVHMVGHTHGMLKERDVSLM